MTLIFNHNYKKRQSKIYTYFRVYLPLAVSLNNVPELLLFLSLSIENQ